MDKASCSDCISCVPNGASANKDEFDFPIDYECMMGNECFPVYGHICCEFLYSEKYMKNFEEGTTDEN